jgi:hypothetical protein
LKLLFLVNHERAVFLFFGSKIRGGEGAGSGSWISAVYKLGFRNEAEIGNLHFNFSRADYYCCGSMLQTGVKIKNNKAEIFIRLEPDEGGFPRAF